MQRAEQALIAFFQRVAERDSAQLAKLSREPRFVIEHDRWIFSLPDLYNYLAEQEAAFNGIDYARFRKLVFNSPVNQAVHSLGAQVTIAENTGKVDRSLYALVWK